MRVVLQVFLKEGVLEIDYLKGGILTQKATYLMGILVTGVFNNWDHHARDSGVASGLMLPLAG